MFGFLLQSHSHMGVIFTWKGILYVGESRRWHVAIPFTYGSYFHVKKYLILFLYTIEVKVAIPFTYGSYFHLSNLTLSQSTFSLSMLQSHSHMGVIFTWCRTATRDINQLSCCNPIHIWELFSLEKGSSTSLLYLLYMLQSHSHMGVIFTAFQLHGIILNKGKRCNPIHIWELFSRNRTQVTLIPVSVFSGCNPIHIWELFSRDGQVYDTDKFQLLVVAIPFTYGSYFHGFNYFRKLLHCIERKGCNPIHIWELFSQEPWWTAWGLKKGIPLLQSHSHMGVIFTACLETHRKSRS